MEEIKNVTNEEIEVIEENVEETKSNKFISKIGSGLKKNGKTIATIAGIGIMTAVGYALGRKSVTGDNEMGTKETEFEDVTDDYSDEEIDE